MTTIRRFCCNDLLRFASVNLDHFTKIYSMNDYMGYLVKWSEYCFVSEAPGNRFIGFSYVDLMPFNQTQKHVMGQTQKHDYWHGQIFGLALAPEYHIIQFAKNLTNHLEDIFDHTDAAFYVDLILRASHSWKIKMFEELGYAIYKRKEKFYEGKEDGFKMRKPLSRDKEKKTIIPPRPKSSYAPDELGTENDDALRKYDEY